MKKGHYFRIAGITILLFNVLIAAPAFAQTADTVAIDTITHSLNTGAKIVTATKLLSDVARTLTLQKQYYTLCF